MCIILIAQLQALSGEPNVHHPQGFHPSNQEAWGQLVVGLAGSSIISSMKVQAIFFLSFSGCW